MYWLRIKKAQKGKNKEGTKGFVPSNIKVASQGVLSKVVACTKMEISPLA